MPWILDMELQDVMSVLLDFGLICFYLPIPPFIMRVFTLRHTILAVSNFLFDFYKVSWLRFCLESHRDFRHKLFSYAQNLKASVTLKNGLNIFCIEMYMTFGGG